MIVNVYDLDGNKTGEREVPDIDFSQYENIITIEDIADAIAELGNIVGITKIYLNKVLAGKITITDVPLLWREKVERLMVK